MSTLSDAKRIAAEVSGYDGQRFQETRDEAANCLTSLSSQVESLRKALEPFAKMADAYDPVEPSDNDNDEAWFRSPKVGELRLARDALNASPAPAESERKKALEEAAKLADERAERCAESARRFDAMPCRDQRDEEDYHRHAVNSVAEARAFVEFAATLRALLTKPAAEG